MVLFYIEPSYDTPTRLYKYTLLVIRVDITASWWSVGTKLYTWKWRQLFHKKGCPQPGPEQSNLDEICMQGLTVITFAHEKRTMWPFLEKLAILSWYIYLFFRDIISLRKNIRIPTYLLASGGLGMDVKLNKIGYLTLI